MVLTQPSSSTSVSISVTVVGTLYVNWGDDTSANYSGSTLISHTYSSAGNYGIILSGKITAITAGGVLGGDISPMTSLTYINIGGSNTITGSIINMTGLTFLALGGSNSVYGSVTNLTGLTCINDWGPTAPLSGSVANLTNLVTLIAYGNNTLSGSVTNLTSLTALRVSGSNTLSGSVTNLSNMADISVGGSNTLTGKLDNMSALQNIGEGGNANFDFSTINWSNLPSLSCVNVKGLTQPQVDALLAAMWANKDQPKPNDNNFSVTRQISCTNGCAAPSAAGYTNKANLQGYASPNGTGPMNWTVNTN